MKRMINTLYIICLTIAFSLVMCYVLSQKDVSDIPYIYLDF